MAATQYIFEMARKKAKVVVRSTDKLFDKAISKIDASPQGCVLVGIRFVKPLANSSGYWQRDLPGIRSTKTATQSYKTSVNRGRHLYG